ncbi:hypothetical protein Mpet_0774 [Methanolacinia petrolearia DSM 11571]|uniref:Uncharacterized protein n=1 Tax=Methanolacinia petrolearia (strain DSM 11571 / OCM 486 / SEBR 4847) TaxID=679926 RepID=E1RIW0_METP4|nr:hypothetical protein [Methanolacinia petrolearia]ADN35548.1 hypothetical protein Mpet_0774 [Methanolacinia petrolearia DSM 11571]
MVTERVVVSLAFCLFIVGIRLDLISGAFPTLTLVTGCLAILIVLVTGLLVPGEIRNQVLQAPK